MARLAEMGCGRSAQRRFGHAELPTFDIRQQCSGFLYALSVADKFIRCGDAKTVLVVGSGNVVHNLRSVAWDRPDLGFDWAPPYRIQRLRKELTAQGYPTLADAAAMAFVAGTDALIIDLRENGGSISPDAIPMLATWFFERPTHLIDLKWNTEPTPRQLWTWAHVPGRRYLEKPVYILTSRRTFSGAEEFAYDLKNLGRATIVGDTTGGGANPR